MLSVTFRPLMLNVIIMLSVIILSVVAPLKGLLKGAPLCQTHSLLANIRLGLKKLPGANALAYYQYE